MTPLDNETISKIRFEFHQSNNNDSFLAENAFQMHLNAQQFDQEVETCTVKILCVLPTSQAEDLIVFSDDVIVGDTKTFHVQSINEPEGLFMWSLSFDFEKPFEVEHVECYTQDKDWTPPPTTVPEHDTRRRGKTATIKAYKNIDHAHTAH